MNRFVSDRYFSKSRGEIIDSLDISPSMCLDVGCAYGAFGEALKGRFGCIVNGIELNECAAARATQVLDVVFHGSLDEYYKTNGNSTRYDAIFLNDILEHLPQPRHELAIVKSLLERGGALIISIPNFLYIDNLCEIIFSRDFRYRSSGILDETHLRFYTRKSIIRLLHEEGLSVSEIKPLNYNKSFKWRLIDIITLGLISEFLVYQWYIKASLREKA